MEEIVAQGLDAVAQGLDDVAQKALATTRKRKIAEISEELKEGAKKNLAKATAATSRQEAISARRLAMEQLKQRNAAQQSTNLLEGHAGLAITTNKLNKAMLTASKEAVQSLKESKVCEADVSDTLEALDEEIKYANGISLIENIVNFVLPWHFEDMNNIWWGLNMLNTDDANPDNFSFLIREKRRLGRGTSAT